MITTRNQDILATWLCKRIGLVGSPHMRCIGQVESDGKIIGVVGFDGYNGASVMMHVAGEGARWVSKSLLYATFDYAFRRLKCNLVLGLVPSGNKAALRFNRHLGFTVECVMQGAHPDGSLILMSLRRENCRYLDEARYGKEVGTAPTA